MRFLCLHGWGTNSDILEAQLGPLCHHLGANRFEYVDGALDWPASKGIEEVFGKQDRTLAYFDPTSPSSVSKAIEDLAGFIASDGPFEGAIGFSQGAVLAASLIAGWDKISNKVGHGIAVNKGGPFQCAIFLSAAGPAYDLEALSQCLIKPLEPANPNEMITIPTANIWGDNDVEYADVGRRVSELCFANLKTEAQHHSGHGVPSAKDPGFKKMTDACDTMLQKLSS